VSYQQFGHFASDDRKFSIISKHNFEIKAQSDALIYVHPLNPNRGSLISS